MISDFKIPLIFRSDEFKTGQSLNFIENVLGFTLKKQTIFKNSEDIKNKYKLINV